MSQVGDKKKKKQIKRRKTEKNRVSQEGDKNKKNRQAADQDSLTQAEQHRSKRRAAGMMTTKCHVQGRKGRAAMELGKQRFVKQAHLQKEGGARAGQV